MERRRGPDTRGHAVIGVVLVVALVVIGSTVVVAIGGQALRETEHRSDVEHAQRIMTLLDSRIEGVALGGADRRTVRFGRTSGSYRVDPTAGEISVINVDRDDDGVDDDGNIDPDAGGASNDDEYLLEPTTMGAVVYENGDRTIAYQGGGVWQRTADGGARMVSPPEFHYRSQTLTLPVVQVVGEGSAAGSARATVSTGGFRARPVYPNASRTFANGDPFRNPLRNGSVVVRIESEYAEAWGAYFEGRTEGNVSYPADDVVTVELVSLARVGRFDMPLEGDAVTVTGPPDGHGITRGTAGGTAFSIRLRPDDADGTEFSNLQWSLYAEEGDHEFEMHLERAGGSDGCADGSTDIAARLTIYYSWNDGEDYHGWRTTSPIQAQCKDLDPSDAEEEIYLDVTFVDDGLDPDGADNDGEYDDNEDGNDVQLEFQALSSNDLEHFNPNGDLDGSRALDGHSAPWEPVTPTTGSPGTTMATDQLVNHYFGELPDEFDLRVDDKNSDTTNEDASSGEFYNAGSARYVTYLHVTTNQVEVEVED
jgi:hypothetical protein